MSTNIGSVGSRITLTRSPTAGKKSRANRPASSVSREKLCQSSEVSTFRQNTVQILSSVSDNGQ